MDDGYVVHVEIQGEVGTGIQNDFTLSENLKVHPIVVGDFLDAALEVQDAVNTRAVAGQAEVNWAKKPARHDVQVAEQTLQKFPFESGCVLMDDDVWETLTKPPSPG